jgi:alkaline phosphatase D
VADLTWTGKKPYDPDSGDGSVGVELAGTAFSSGSRSGPLTSSDSGSRTELERNSVFQWQDDYYRGYFILHLNHEKMTAQFFGSPSVATRNAWDLPLANLTMFPGVNHLERPVAGGIVETGALRGGEVKHTNLTFNTETNEWKVIGFEKMYL